MSALVIVGTCVLWAASFLLLLLGWVHRRRDEHRRRRREERLRQLRPLLVAIAAGDAETDPVIVDDLMRVEGDLFVRAAVEMLTKLRGGAHAQLAALLVRRGVVAEARQHLVSSKPDVRARAAALLGAVADRGSVGDVAWLLRDPVPDVALVAARALGKQGDARMVPRLLAALDGAQPLPMGVVSTSLLQLGATAIEPLTRGLAVARPVGRAVSAEVLGRLGAIEATAPLIRALLFDPDREVRLRSGHALGCIGSPKAAPALTQVVASTDDSVLRAVCVRALGEVGSAETVPLLVDMLVSPHHTVAWNAAAALAALQPEGVAALRAVAEGGGREAQYALEVLASARLGGGPGWEGARS